MFGLFSKIEVCAPRNEYQSLWFLSKTKMAIYFLRPPRGNGWGLLRPLWGREEEKGPRCVLSQAREIQELLKLTPSISGSPFDEWPHTHPEPTTVPIGGRPNAGVLRGELRPSFCQAFLPGVPPSAGLDAVAVVSDRFSRDASFVSNFFSRDASSVTWAL